MTARLGRASRNGSMPSPPVRSTAGRYEWSCSAARARTRRDGEPRARRCRRASPSPPSVCDRLLRARPQAARGPQRRRWMPPCAEIGDTVGAHFGDVERRCSSPCAPGARASMPGMMDTILNLGLNDETVEGLGKRSGDAPLRLRQLSPLHPDVCRRGARRRPRVRSRIILENLQEPERAARSDTDLKGRRSGRRSSQDTRRRSRSDLGKPFPQDTDAQLCGAIAAVFGSWQNARANTYRRPT